MDKLRKRYSLLVHVYITSSLMLLIFIHAAHIYVTRMPRAGMRMHVVAAGNVVSQTRLCIGCVGAESNAPVDSNTGESTRPCTSGIDYFGAEDSTSCESSTGDPSRLSCAAT